MMMKKRCVLLPTAFCFFFFFFITMHLSPSLVHGRLLTSSLQLEANIETTHPSSPSASPSPSPSPSPYDYGSTPYAYPFLPSPRSTQSNPDTADSSPYDNPINGFDHSPAPSPAPSSAIEDDSPIAAAHKLNA